MLLKWHITEAGKIIFSFAFRMDFKDFFNNIYLRTSHRYEELILVWIYKLIQICFSSIVKIMLLKWHIIAAGNMIISFEFRMKLDDFDMYVIYVSQIFNFKATSIFKN